MRAAFVLTATDDPTGYVAADFCLRSLKRHMPDVEVWQLTDRTSPSVVGVDNVVRMSGNARALPFTRFMAAMYATVAPDGEWLFLDTDVVVQQDVRHIFDVPAFDLAVADRAGTYLEGESGSEFMAAMPYNAGVMFSRPAAPWGAITEAIDALPVQQQQWLGVQLALAALIPSGGVRASILPPTYNYPPHAADEDVSTKACVHYKGPWRKRVLIERVYRETVCASV